MEALKSLNCNLFLFVNNNQHQSESYNSGEILAKEMSCSEMDYRKSTIQSIGIGFPIGRDTENDNGYIDNSPRRAATSPLLYS